MMKKFSKALLSIAAVSAVSAAMAASAMAADTITAEYANGKLSLSGVTASGDMQTLLIFKGAATDSVTSANANEIVVAIDQEDGDTTDSVLLDTDVPVRELEEGATYQIRVGGTDGNVQTGTFTYTNGGVDPDPGETITIMIGDVTLDGRLSGVDASAIAKSLIFVDDDDTAHVKTVYEVVSGIDAPTFTVGDTTLDGRVSGVDASAIAKSLIFVDDDDTANVKTQIQVKAK